MITIPIKTEKSYDIKLGHGLSDKLDEFLIEFIDNGKILIITDENIDKHYGESILNQISKRYKNLFKYVVSPGEGSKDITTYYNIMEFLAKNEFTRTDIIIALGGGVIGDLGGFVAATYMRGISYIQMPTSLLSTVDSSIGGKTAINLKSGKNMVGSFYQPKAVIIDLDFLKTLPVSEFSNGMGEIIKYGIMYDRELFKRVSPKNVIDSDIEDVVIKSINIKKVFVEHDERDLGLRQHLNLGHTFGHAIERLSNYTLPHGYAVSIGLVMMSRAAFKLGFSKEDFTDQVIEACLNNNLPISSDYSVDEIVEQALHDKKRGNSEITLVIPTEIGKTILKKIPISALTDFVKAGKA